MHLNLNGVRCQTHKFVQTKYERDFLEKNRAQMVLNDIDKGQYVLIKHFSSVLIGSDIKRGLNNINAH